ncbi:MAG: hypothetical protein AAF699_01075 [Pseudomonadota bacterium]
MKNLLSNSSLGQQLAVVSAGLCLSVSLALVTLAAISTGYMQLQQQDEYGSALARQVASRISIALETGDLLSASASLHRFVETSSAQQVTIFDVEGKALVQAGDASSPNQHEYRAPVRIEDDVAGRVVITIGTDTAKAARLQFVLSLIGLAILLSLTVYITTRHFGQRLAGRISELSSAIALDDRQDSGRSLNELDNLARDIEALPMDLLRTRSKTNPREENYRTTAVLYLHLTSLADYIETLDERALHRYTDRLHHLVLAAGDFYAGELRVARQFGLAVFFNGPNSAGSAAFRAASCAWLIEAASRELEKTMRRNLGIAMAISQSELGVGDEADIYPGLYMQHTLDELESICANRPPRVLLAPGVCTDSDVAARLQHRETEVQEFAVMETFEEPYHDLLERQLQLIIKKMTDA